MIRYTRGFDLTGSPKSMRAPDKRLFRDTPAVRVRINDPALKEVFLNLENGDELVFRYFDAFNQNEHTSSTGGRIAFEPTLVCSQKTLNAMSVYVDSEFAGRVANANPTPVTITSLGQTTSVPWMHLYDIEVLTIKQIDAYLDTRLADKLKPALKKRLKAARNVLRRLGMNKPLINQWMSLVDARQHPGDLIFELTPNGMSLARAGATPKGYLGAPTQATLDFAAPDASAIPGSEEAPAKEFDPLIGSKRMSELQKEAMGDGMNDFIGKGMPPYQTKVEKLLGLNTEAKTFSAYAKNHPSDDLDLILEEWEILQRERRLEIQRRIAGLKYDKKLAELEELEELEKYHSDPKNFDLSTAKRGSARQVMRERQVGKGLPLEAIKERLAQVGMPEMSKIISSIDDELNRRKEEGARALPNTWVEMSEEERTRVGNAARSKGNGDIQFLPETVRTVVEPGEVLSLVDQAQVSLGSVKHIMCYPNSTTEDVLMAQSVLEYVVSKLQRALALFE